MLKNSHPIFPCCSTVDQPMSAPRYSFGTKVQAGDRNAAGEMAGTMQATRATKSLPAARLNTVKRAFCTRRADLSGAVLLDPSHTPTVGSLVLSEVVSLGHHARLELCDGRRSKLFVGDEVITCYGHRYAPDQYEATVPSDLGQCALVTSGGVTGIVEHRHAGVGKATQLQPVGLLGDANGMPLTLDRFSLPRPSGPWMAHAPVFAVLGTSMNAGKTTTAAHLIHGLKRAGLRVAAAKITGTGSGADYWHLRDAGAVAVLDFSDCGLPSTYRVELEALHAVLMKILAELGRSAPDAIVLEVADGLYQRETAMLIEAPWFREVVDNVLFAATDAMSMFAGVTLLRQHGLPVVALSGVISSSPLAMREAVTALAMPVLTVAQLEDPEVITPLVFAQSHVGR